jgi:hypothetical protein
MNAKDTVVGTTRSLVAEIVGDGALADEGSPNERDCVNSPFGGPRK